MNSIKLSQTKTLKELQEMQEQLAITPEGGKYNTATLKKIDDVCWAMTYLRQREEKGG